MAELKPCRCGSERAHMLHAYLRPGYMCLVGCLDMTCNETVIRCGLTKNHAEKRAVKAWNRRATGGK